MPNSAEDAVRRYFTALNDPSAVQPDTSDVDARIEASDDPVERLQLRAEKAKASDPMPEIRDAFITHAKAWADEHGVRAEDMRAEGADVKDLRAAGFSVGGRTTTRRSARTTTRRARVSAEDVHAALPKKGQTFTSKSLQESTGASPATVRKVIATLTAEGAVDDLGPDPDATGPGRAPNLYKVKKK